MKKLLKAIRLILKTLWPKSRWANLVYLILGFVVAHFADIKDLIEAIKELL